MKILQVGQHTLNLDYWIRHRNADGAVQVVMLGGDLIELCDKDATEYLRKFAEVTRLLPETPTAFQATNVTPPPAADEGQPRNAPKSGHKAEHRRQRHGD